MSAKKPKKTEEVEVQITPMLDMAFQLLTFFILTYRPSPTEGQFALNLMPAQAVAPTDDAPSADAPPNDSTPPALKSVTTTLRADAEGNLATVSMADNDVPPAKVQEEIKRLYKDPSLPFDQALIQVDPKLKYSELMKIVDAFSKEEVTKVSFAELGSGPAGGTK